MLRTWLISITSPHAVQKTTVEAIAYIPESDNLWLGLASGQVQILDIGTGTVSGTLQVHKSRITTMLPVKDCVWTSSFDTKIHILYTKSRQSIATLEAGSDIISCLKAVRHLSPLSLQMLTLTQGPSGSIWSSCMSGILTEWEASTHEKMRTVDLSKLLGRRTAILHFLFVDNTIWYLASTVRQILTLVCRCATGTSIVVIDLSSGKVQRRNSNILPYTFSFDDDSAGKMAKLALEYVYQSWSQH